MHDGEWFIIDTLSGSLSVIAAGSRGRKWRPLPNVFRGKSLTMVQKLVEVVVDNLKDSQSLVDLTPGTKLAYARPILGPGRQVHAVMVWLGTKEDNPPPPPEAIGWTWDLDSLGFPTRDYAPAAAEFHGYPRESNPTLTELLSMGTRLSDTATLLDVLDNIDEDAVGTGEWRMIRPDGVYAKIRYAFRYASFGNGRTIHGISQRVAGYDGDPKDSMDGLALRSLAHASGRYAALLHTRTRRVLAWLSEAPRYLPAGVIRGLEQAPQPQDTFEFAGLPKTVTLAIFGDSV
ncbi:GAF domain-containing protein [Nocardia sp. NPDC004278]